ncbi:MAG: class I SAM-dependent methyltransferase [Phycisphaerales bacterium]|nr:MAG: class I SAM-dependent methyltransferase [Phycisphaerales bacterium]
MTEFQELWAASAKSDLEHLASSRRGDIVYRPRNVLGHLLLKLARRHIFTYAIEDRPKERWLQQAMTQTGTHILDIGVRTGYHAHLFKKRGKRVYGLDIASVYIDHCLKSASIDYGAVCDVERDQIPVPADFACGLPTYYDAIFAGEIIEHLLDARRFFYKLARVCRPGGCLIVTTPNLAYLGNRFRLLLGRDLHPLTMDRGVTGHQHIRVYTCRLLGRLLAEVGFRITQVAGDGLLLDLRRALDTVRISSQRSTLLTDSQPPLLTVPFSGTLLPRLGLVLYVQAHKGSDHADPLPQAGNTRCPSRGCS